MFGDGILTDIDMNEKELNEFLSYCKECVKQIDHALGIDDGLTDVKAVAFAGLVSYYGEEHFNDIYMSFFKTKFVRYPGSINKLLVGLGISLEDALKYSEHSPYTFYMPVAKKDLKTNKYTIERSIYVGDYDNTAKLVESIVHQMNHVVNSLYNSVVNKRNSGLGARMGVSVDSFLTRKCESLKLEEAYNKLQVKDIMDRIMTFSIFDITVPGIISVLDDVFHNTGFSENDDDFMVEIIRPLYLDEEFNKTLVERRLNGRLAGIREEFDSKTEEGSYLQLVGLCDKLANNTHEEDKEEAKRLVKMYLEK